MIQYGALRMTHRGIATLKNPFDLALMAAMPRPILAIDDGSQLLDDIVPALEYLHAHLRAGHYVVVEDGNLAEFSHRAFTANPNGWLRRPVE